MAEKKIASAEELEELLKKYGIIRSDEKLTGYDELDWKFRGGETYNYAADVYLSSGKETYSRRFVQKSIVKDIPGHLVAVAREWEKRMGYLNAAGIKTPRSYFDTATIYHALS